MEFVQEIPFGILLCKTLPVRTDHLPNDALQESTEDDNPVVEDPIDFSATHSQSAFENVLQDFYAPLEVWYCRTVLDKVRYVCATQKMTTLNVIRPTETRRQTSHYPQSHLQHPTTHSIFSKSSSPDFSPLARLLMSRE